MCFGGGDDGSKEAKLQRQQAEKEKAQRQRQRDKVNLLFGMGEGVTNPFQQFNTVTESKPMEGVRTERHVQEGPDEVIYITGRGHNEKRYNAMPMVTSTRDVLNPEWQAFQTMLDGSRDNGAKREANYQTLQGDVRNFHMTDLEEQQREAERRTRFQLADQGLTGGSEDTYAHSNLNRGFDKGLRAIDDIATRAVQDARRGDEQARLDILSRIDAGMDEQSAISAAINQLNSSTKGALSDARGASLGDAFSNMGYLWDRYQYGQGADRARRLYGQLGGAPTPGSGSVGGGGYSGQIINDRP